MLTLIHSRGLTFTDGRLYWKHNNESGIIYFMNFTQSAASCMILLEVGACIEMGGGRIRLRGSYDVICGVLTALN